VPYELTLPVLPEAEAEAFPHVAEAVALLAGQALALWKGYAQGEPLPGGGRINARSGAYLDSIQLRQVGPYAWELYSDAPYASAIERGAPAVDLKRMLDSSWRVREVKGKGPHQGQRYLIIPFRHGHPGANYNAMPKEVHEVAKRLDASHLVAKYREPTVPEAYSVSDRARMTVERNRYTWGGRLKGPEFAGTRYQGMVRFDAKGGRHSGFVTFRVMGEWSSGWQSPPRAGLYPLQAVREHIAKGADALVERALELDLGRHLEQLPL
jgi:hypothetical protein